MDYFKWGTGDGKSTGERQQQQLHPQLASEKKTPLPNIDIVAHNEKKSSLCHHAQQIEDTFTS